MWIDFGESAHLCVVCLSPQGLGNGVFGKESVRSCMIHPAGFGNSCTECIGLNLQGRVSLQSEDNICDCVKQDVWSVDPQLLLMQ